jgi:uncharacterized protein
MSRSNPTDQKGFPVSQVIFRKTAPIDAPEARYPGFKPGTTTLTRGAVLNPGALPLPCDILFERDVAVKLRDGTVIYTDVFRPVNGTSLPAIVAWSPYGKHISMSWCDDYPDRAGVPVDATSGLEKFEGPDPAYWCKHGYAIVNPDARGAFMSEGDIQFWGTQEARDCYDFIEWVAAQNWSNGKVAMSGNSWLAIIQWFAAAERPPHLAAIAPWEGVADLYRDDVCRGGIPNASFNETITGRQRGRNRVEDVPAMVQKYPLMNAYWEDKVAKLEKIDVPAYIVASWINTLHTHGTFEGFRRISSRDKWLRVHNIHEWADYFVPENVEGLRRFFDRYLKGIENGWERTPKVRLSVLDPGGVDEVNRPENEFPLARTQHKSLYLDGRTGTLSYTPATGESAVRYRADDGEDKAVFAIRFNEETELTGYMKLRLWIEADGSNDMDLFVFVQKLDGQGNFLPACQMGMPDSGAKGKLRVSHRQLDAARSTPSEPYLTHRAEELLSPGQVVPVDISIWPIGMLWHAGQQLRLIVAGHYVAAQPIPGSGEEPLTRNKGWHIIHTGGKYDSHLLVPVIPR